MLKKAKTEDTSSKKQRVQLDLSPKMTALIDQLADDESSTRADVIRRAISLYAVILDERKHGRRLELVGPGPNDRSKLVLAF